MFGDYVRLSFGNLKKRGVRSWLTMLGIFIGIAAVVSLISLGQGLQSAITGQFSVLDPDKLIIRNAETGFGPPGSTAIKKLTDKDIELIEEVNGIDVVVSRLIRVVNVEFNDKGDFSFVSSLPEEQDEIDLIYDSTNMESDRGRLLNKNDRNKVVLGNDFTDDRFGKEIRVGRKIIIQGEEFEVVGILKKTGTFTLNSAIVMPERDLRRVLGLKDGEHDIIVVQVKNKNEIGEIAKNIEERFREERNLEEGEEDFSVETPEQSLQTINTVLIIINLVVGGIAAVSLFVGGVGITNTMYTSVLERTKEIGVMKAVGARNSDVLSIFLIESGLLGIVGGIVGAVIGLVLALFVSLSVGKVFPGLNFSVNVSYYLIVLAIVFSFVVGTISGLFPALRASRLKPVEALRA